jgi:hypothetical protein
MNRPTRIRPHSREARELADLLAPLPPEEQERAVVALELALGLWIDEHDARYMRRVYLQSDVFAAGQSRVMTTLADRPDLVTVSYNYMSSGVPQATTYIRGALTADIRAWVTEQSASGDKDYQITVQNLSSSELYVNVAAYRASRCRPASARSTSARRRPLAALCERVGELPVSVQRNLVAAETIQCSRCGERCHDYRQRGGKRLCICCVSDELQCVQARVSELEASEARLIAEGQREIAEARAEVERLRSRLATVEGALRDLLLSADCTWEERRLGHDWADACEAARAALSPAPAAEGERDA